jgi:hypothetical protein
MQTGLKERKLMTYSIFEYKPSKAVAKRKAYRVLSLDLSTTNTGFAILDKLSKSLHESLIKSGASQAGKQNHLSYVPPMEILQSTISSVPGKASLLLLKVSDLLLVNFVSLLLLRPLMTLQAMQLMLLPQRNLLKKKPRA